MALRRMAVVLMVLVGGCLPDGGNEESMLNSSEADAQLRQLIAATAEAAFGDREVVLYETGFGACDLGVPSKEVNLSIYGRVTLREGERASEFLPAARRFFDEHGLDVEEHEDIAREVIGRTAAGLSLGVAVAEGDEQLGLRAGSRCVENVQPRVRVPSDTLPPDPPVPGATVAVSDVSPRAPTAAMRPCAGGGG